MAPREVLLALLIGMRRRAARDIETIRVVVGGATGGEWRHRRNLRRNLQLAGVFGVGSRNWIPAAIGALMLGRGQYSGVGVQAPEICCAPEPFFGELAKRHMPVRTGR